MSRQILKPSRWTRALRWLGAIGTATTLAACGGGGGGGGAEVSTGAGTLRVALTDAPSCGYDHVWVTIEKVRVHKNAGAADADSGWSELVVSPARRVDLLDLTNGVLEELGSMQLEAGSYSQVRLVLADNGGANATANALQPTGGTVTALATPSAQQSGLKLKANFDVAAGQTADIVLDFDACKSIVKAGNSGKYNLKPVVSVFPRLTTGIQGYVSTTLSLGSTTVAAQQDGATVRATAPDATGKFSIPYLPAGTYTLVVTSEGRSTAVVTSVPVGTATGSTTVNGTATAITPPVSSMADVTGTVVTSTISGSTTVSTVLGDATVQATQALTGGPTIDVGAQNVDDLLGSYRFHLPVAAPVKAPFVSAATPLVFTADTAVAAKYSLRASTPGKTPQDKPLTLVTGTNASINFSFTP